LRNSLLRHKRYRIPLIIMLLACIAIMLFPPWYILAEDEGVPIGGSFGYHFFTARPKLKEMPSV